VYKAAIVLSTIPALLMVFAWTRAFGIRRDPVVPNWRVYCLFASLIAASCAIAVGLAESLAWLNAGGDPHGMGTPLGSWEPLRRLFLWTLLLTALLALFAKGRGRIAGVAAAAAALFANVMVAVITFD
jgi:hypothetical protein